MASDSRLTNSDNYQLAATQFQVRQKSEQAFTTLTSGQRSAAPTIMPSYISVILSIGFVSLRFKTARIKRNEMKRNETKQLNRRKLFHVTIKN